MPPARWSGIAAELGARGYETHLITAHNGAVPWLAVRNSQASMLSEKVTAQRAGSCGHGRTASPRQPTSARRPTASPGCCAPTASPSDRSGSSARCEDPQAQYPTPAAAAAAVRPQMSDRGWPDTEPSRRAGCLPGPGALPRESLRAGAADIGRVGWCWPPISAARSRTGMLSRWDARRSMSNAWPAGRRDWAMMPLACSTVAWSPAGPPAA